MKQTFNNVYTKCLKPLLTGEAHTPPTGVEWPDMIKPFKWAVYRYEHRKKYEAAKKKINSR